MRICQPPLKDLARPAELFLAETQPAQHLGHLGVGRPAVQLFKPVLELTVAGQGVGRLGVLLGLKDGVQTGQLVLDGAQLRQGRAGFLEQAASANRRAPPGADSRG